MPKEKKRKENYFKKRKYSLDESVWRLLLVFWMIGIFILSGIEGSGERYWDFWMLVERKGAHLFEFFVLAYLFWKVFSFYFSKFWQQIQLTFLSSLLYASWDEVHQLFVFGREGKLLDVGVDLIGVLFFVIIVQLQKSFFAERKNY